MRQLRTAALLALIFIVFGVGTLAAAPERVAIIPIQGEIEPGLAKFVERAYGEAEMQQSDLVILELGTLGGRVDAALQIRDRVEHSSLPTVAFVKERAISAGSLISLATDRIYMTPSATLGAAEPMVGSQPAPEKIVSFWRTEMEGTAERHQHDPMIAAAMVDKAVDLPGVSPRGELLTLTANRALQLKLADGIVQDRPSLLAQLGASVENSREIKPTAAEQLARAVISPAWSTILLSLGFGGALVELLHPGFGVAGAISLVSWVLFFAGHWLAGLAGWEVIILFLLGIGLLVVEAVIPGFGILGLGGIASVIGSIVLAVGGRAEGLRSLLISLIVVAVLVIALIRQFGRRGLWQRIILSTQLNREDGFVSTSSSLRLLVGSEGKVLTPLRPTGMALIDGQRVNVISEGEFIPTGRIVRVLRVEGNHVIVGQEPSDQDAAKV